MVAACKGNDDGLNTGIAGFDDALARALGCTVEDLATVVAERTANSRPLPALRPGTRRAGEARCHPRCECPWCDPEEHISRRRGY
ncbi:MAG: hypothetical protein ACPGQD_06130 [Planctomycetota bacterium]